MRKHKIVATGAVGVAAVIVAILWPHGPQIFGTLPSEEVTAVRAVLDADTRAALRSSRALGGTTGLGEWIFERRDRRLLRLQIEATNRVLAFYRTATSSGGRILILSRGKQGWWISDTNTSVQIK